MKTTVRYLFISFLFLTTAHLVFAQNIISNEELIGKWTLIKGSGNDFDKNNLGSIFDFQNAGMIQIDLAPLDAVRTDDNEGKGTWILKNNVLTIGLFGEDNETVDALEMTITKYHKQQLFITTKKDGISIVFEKKKTN